ncbi:MAG: AarF/UbiB family protein [Gemmatimonadaceae bacterium]|jgi:predicted unusual protein kinase regulating ubiquinone biosynthesis (AarF/ABC1/UbiB family)|nr:AarF/UbiB family protein [Gemmatimonadaceae bacterium]
MIATPADALRALPATPGALLPDAPPLPSVGRVALLRRAVVVLWHALPLVLSVLRDSRRWVVRGAPLPRSADFHARRADRLVATLATLGPTYVKLAQMAAARADLIPGVYVDRLATLLDRVPAVPWSAIESTLRRSLTPEQRAALSPIDRTPLAAGSLGQVHAARLATATGSRDVVIKLLRPGIAGVIALDLAILRAIVGWVYGRFPHPHVKGYLVVLDQFEHHVRDELDFRREAVATATIRARFAHEPRIRIPEVIDGFTGIDVLVLARVEGQRIDQLDASRLRPGQLDALVEQLIASYIRMMLIDGRFHADPHPGNLWLAPDGALVFLDFGMVSDVSLATRRQLLRTIVASIRRDPLAIAQGFESLEMLVPGTSPAQFAPLAQTLLQIGFSPLPSDERARLVADEVMRELFNWPITLPPALVYFARTAALIEGVGARYDRHFNSIGVATRVVMRLYPEIARALGESVWNLPPDAMASVAGTMAGTAAREAVSTARRLERALGAAWAATRDALFEER